MNPREHRSEEDEDLGARVARLEAENDALRRRVAAPAAGRWRSAGAATLIVLGLLLGSVSAVTGYVRGLLVDTDQFVTAFAPLATDPAVQDVLVEATDRLVDETVDIPALTADLFDGLRSLDLPPRASSALTLLQAPVTQGARSLVRGMVENVIASPAFGEVWKQALRITHTDALRVLQGDPDAALAAGDGGTLTLQLGPVLDSVRSRLRAEGVTFATAIPTTDRSIVLLHGDTTGRVVAAYGLVVTVSAWLPWVAVALLAGGILLARRRRRATVAAGVAAVAIVAVLLLAVGLGRAVLVGDVAASGTVITPAAAASVADHVGEPLLQRLLALGVLALVVALLAWGAGPSRGARSVRGLGGRIMTVARPVGAGSGVWNTVGRTIDGAHRWILAAIAVLAGAAILLISPLTVWLVVWTLLVAAFVAAVIELLRRPGTDRQSPAAD